MMKIDKEKKIELLESILRDPTVADQEKPAIRERKEVLENQNQKQEDND